MSQADKKAGEHLRAGITPMGFWKGECCEGLIVDKNVDVSKKVREKYVFIKNVPAGVCKECGTRYYTANVLKTIEGTTRERRKADRQVLVPVHSL